MAQRVADDVVTKRFVHANGSTSHFHVRGGVVLLTGVHPEPLGNPAEITREEFLKAWDSVTAEAEKERLLG